MSKYPEYSSLNMPAIEAEIGAKWKAEDTFKQSVEGRDGATPFVFYEGPPSANGLPGIHHVISRTLKDLVCRYKTMQGHQVQRKAGWDTHGLPVELGVEKELGITKEDIGKSISVEDYNQKCREAVMRYTAEWESITEKMGYWVDMQHPYVTYDTDYIESLWWCLKTLFDKGLLYKSVSIQPYSPAAGTGLSSHELNQPGTYKDVKDTTVVAMFRVTPERLRQAQPDTGLRQAQPDTGLRQAQPDTGLRQAQPDTGLRQAQPDTGLRQAQPDTGLRQAQPDTEEKSVTLSLSKGDTFFLAWTTTPWTLPSNCGLTVGPNIDYVFVKTFNPYTHEPCNVVLAKALLGKYFKPEGENGDFDAYAEATGRSGELSPAGGGNGGSAAEGASTFGEGVETHHKGRGETITRSHEDAPTAPGNPKSEIRNPKSAIPWQILAEMKGRDLEGIRYEQLLPFEANQKGLSGGDPFRVILGDFVTTEDGTGVVHTAPAFGADDFRVGKKEGIGIFTLVDKQGKFVDGMDNLGEAFHLSGKFVKNYRSDPDYKDVDLEIALHLKAAGRAFKIEKYEHNYPHCWRTDKPIIYYPLDAWFIRTTAAKERMIELNKTINWKPKSTGEGRFGNWLENMVDWNLSRSRYWGTPLPIWVSEDGAKMKCIGSVAELEKEITHANDRLGTNQFIHPSMLPDGERERDSFSKEGGGIDLHKPWVDQIILATDDGRPMLREPDLIDVWFDSGAMPYAQQHYPFENKELIDNGLSRDEFPIGGREYLKYSFPADFIAEGVDQTRGWFYTLHALGVLLFDSVAYKTVVSNGLVLDKNGAKMSKRLGNVVNPFETIEKYSADATRWYLITNASPWDSLKFDINGIGEVQRKFFGTLYNTYQFFALYANVDGFAFKERYIPLDDRPEIDRWILSVLNSLVQEVSAALDDYEPTAAGRAIEYFLDEQLSNWYVRLCRRRFWKGEYAADKIAAYQTLYECLETLSLLIAPISPFFADWLYCNLDSVSDRMAVSSVHLGNFPKHNERAVDEDLEGRMKLAQDVSSLVLSLRKKAGIRVRQPLQRILIPVLDARMTKQLQGAEELIKTEVNVKSIEYITDSEGFISKKVKPDFKRLGARLGAKMKAAALKIVALDQSQIATLERTGHLEMLLDDGSPVTVAREDVEIIAEDVPGWSVAAKDSLTVALDITQTPELIQEGLAREFVNRIQKLRKDLNFDLTDRIRVQYGSHPALDVAIMGYKEYICTEILAEDIISLAELSDGVLVDLEGTHLKILLTKLH